MTKSALVFWMDLSFTISIYVGLVGGVIFGGLQDYSYSDVFFSYAYGGCITIILSRIVWSGCPLRILESSLRGHQHVPNKSWLYKMVARRYNHETARAAIWTWCGLCLTLNMFTIYMGLLLWRHF